MSSEEELSDSEIEQEEAADEFLTTDAIESEMNETISEVQAILQIKTGVCRILLHKYKWNKEALFDRFYEHPDTKAFLIAAKVIPNIVATSFPKVPDTNAECDICCNVAKLTGLACNHRSCSKCWKAYLTEKIVVGRQCEIECMAPKCQLLIDDEKVMFYVKDTTVKATYGRLTVNSYVDTNVYLKWCPGVDCGRAVKVSSTSAHLIACPCGARFCFSCSRDWHEPIHCDHLKQWLKRCTDDSQTYNWIVANTKDCPKCSVTIEKDGGCNHMSCRNTSCQYEFCWLCMGEWQAHQTAGCNSYEDKNKDTREKSRASLDRYLFFYNRYMAHRQSLQLEQKLKASVLIKTEELQETASLAWVEVQFLRKAVDVLSDCRRTLMNTYAFAFFLQNDNNSLIFNENQKDLEMATEQLSGYLERDLNDEECIVTLRPQVQDKCRYVEHRRKILLDHCTEGYEQNTWEFNEFI